MWKRLRPAVDYSIKTLGNEEKGIVMDRQLYQSHCGSRTIEQVVNKGNRRIESGMGRYGLLSDERAADPPSLYNREIPTIAGTG